MFECGEVGIELLEMFLSLDEHHPSFFFLSSFVVSLFVGVIGCVRL